MTLVRYLTGGTRPLQNPPPGAPGLAGLPAQAYSLESFLRRHELRGTDPRRAVWAILVAARHVLAVAEARGELGFEGADELEGQFALLERSLRGEAAGQELRELRRASQVRYYQHYAFPTARPWAEEGLLSARLRAAVAETSRLGLVPQALQDHQPPRAWQDASLALQDLMRALEDLGETEVKPRRRPPRAAEAILLELVRQAVEGP